MFDFLTLPFMLPGKAPEKRNYQKTKYAFDAIKEMLKDLNNLGIKENDIEICLVGGGNVLRKKDDTIASDNIASVDENLLKRNLTIKARNVGGTQRRSVSLFINTACVYFSVGDGHEKILYRFENKE